MGMSNTGLYWISVGENIDLTWEKCVFELFVDDLFRVNVKIQGLQLSSFKMQQKSNRGNIYWPKLSEHHIHNFDPFWSSEK